jgi:DNA-binding response OmpR family regulator
MWEALALRAHWARAARALTAGAKLGPVNTARVLVVDDSEPVRTLLAKALRQHGFEVHAAESGTDALRLAYDLRPDLAIVDQWMPGMTGAELIRLLRGAPVPEVRTMAIIGLSGRSGSERDLLGAGAGSFIAKPFGELELVAAVRTALGRSARPESGAA